MWNPFNKKNDGDSDVSDKDTQKMGMFQKMAMKKAMNMKPEEREKMMQEALEPKNRDKLLKAIEQMEKSGMISKSQIEKAKKQLGIE